MAQHPKNLRKTIPRLTRFNKNALQQAELARCTYCLEIFEPHLICEWLEEPEPNQTSLMEEETALCPFCGIDKVTPFK